MVYKNAIYRRLITSNYYVNIYKPTSDGFSGVAGDDCYDPTVGIRPAMKIDLSNVHAKEIEEPTALVIKSYPETSNAFAGYSYEFGLNLYGLRVSAVFADGTEKDVTGLLYYNYDFSSAGENVPVEAIYRRGSKEISTVFYYNVFSSDEVIQFGQYPSEMIDMEWESSSFRNGMNDAPKTWKSFGFYSSVENTHGYDDEETYIYYDKLDLGYGEMVPCDYMEYADFTYSGEKYRAVRCTGTKPEQTNVSYIDEWGYYNKYTEGTIYYFKFMPLEWKLTNPITMTYFCVSSVDCMPFNSVVYKPLNTSEDPDYEFRLYIDEELTIPAEDYGTSTIRSWLNDDFLNTAFTQEEQGQLGYTRSYSDYYNYGGRQEVYDLVALPSEDLISEYYYNLRYSVDVKNDIKHFTQYALFQDAYIYNLDDVLYNYGYNDNDNYAMFWALTQPNYINVHSPQKISYNEYYEIQETSGSPACANYVGVRPVISMKTNYITDVELVKEPTQKLYTFGFADSVNLEGAELKVTYLNGRTASVKYSDASSSAFTASCDMSSAGTKNVTVTYYEKGQKFTLNYSVDIYDQQKVTFGSYPQSEVTDESLLSALDGIEKNWVSYGFVEANGPGTERKRTDYAKYADITYNGEKYRAVLFTKYRAELAYYPPEADKSLQDDNGYDINKIYYFRFDPLTWVKLNNDGLLMCNSVVDAQFYNAIPVEPIVNWQNSNDKAFDKSEMRRWLNTDFYNTAFTDAEKSSVLVTYNDHSTMDSENPEYTAATYDSVLLPDYNIVCNPAYGYSPYGAEDENRICKATDYARCLGLDCSLAEETYANANYLLLSSSAYFGAAIAYSSSTGRVSKSDSSTNWSLYRNTSAITGVRPVITVSDAETATPVSMERVCEPMKNTVHADGEFDSFGLVYEVTYSDGETRYKSDFDFEYDFSSLGDDSVTVKYTENGVTLTDTLDVSANEHTFRHIKITAGCITDGTEYDECTGCGFRANETVKEATGHNWNNWSVYTTPSATQSGVNRRTCSKCSAKEEEVIPAIAHDCTIEGTSVSGIAPGTKISDVGNYFSFDGATITVTNPNGGDYIGTGTTIKIKTSKKTETFTVTIFGDNNGDGLSDGTDAMTVKMLADGMLTENDVSKAQYQASDCNHDGVINNEDVEILEQAGLLLTDVSQTKDTESGHAELSTSGTLASRIYYTFNEEAGVLTISGTGTIPSYASASASPFAGREFSEIIIDEGITEIGSYAFPNCDIGTLTTPITLNNVYDNAFVGSTADNIIVNYYIIEGSAFDVGETGNEMLADPGSFEEYVYEIVTDTITACYNGKTMGLSYSGTGAIPDYSTENPCTFAGTSEVHSVVFEEGITHIGDFMLFSCTGFESLTLPDSLESIGEYAFTFDKGLKTVTIGKNLTEIGDAAFILCSELKEFTVSEENSAFCSVDGVLYSKDKKELVCYPAGKTDTEFVIPNGTEVLGVTSLAYCKNLTSVTIPSSVTEISDVVFIGMDNLTDVYYLGTQAEWESITMGDSNTSLKNANIVFLAE